MKCHDGAINGTIKFSGNFKYVKDLLKRLFINSNANQLCETIYENGKKYTMYHFIGENGSKPSVQFIESCLKEN